jgi:hypothetical protein
MILSQSKEHMLDLFLNHMTRATWSLLVHSSSTLITIVDQHPVRLPLPDPELVRALPVFDPTICSEDGQTLKPSPSFNDTFLAYPSCPIVYKF